jgi:hypothetical protein
LPQVRHAMEIEPAVARGVYLLQRTYARSS